MTSWLVDYKITVLRDFEIVLEDTPDFTLFLAQLDISNVEFLLTRRKSRS